MATCLGMVFSMLGLIGAIVVIVRKIMNPAMMMGWASLMAAIFFFSGLILFSLGLIGEYIGRMFLGMGNNPQFVVREIYTKDSDSSVNFEDLGKQ